MKYPKIDGMYVIDGEKYKLLTGSRAQVWHGTAYKTTGGLLKGDLVKNKHGEIVSKKKHEQESKDSNLIKHGYGFKTDGTFGYEKIKGVSGITARNSKRKASTRKSKKDKKSKQDTDLVQQGGYQVEDNTLPGLASTAAQFGGRKHKRRTYKGGNSSTWSPDNLYGGRRHKSRHRRQHSSSSLAGGYSATSSLFL